MSSCKTVVEVGWQYLSTTVQQQQDVQYCVEGQLYPKEWIRKENDLLYSQYAALNLEHQFTVDRIVDEKYDQDGNIQFRIKFVGLELDTIDWVYAKDVRGPVLEQWQKHDREFLRKLRTQNQHQMIKFQAQKQFERLPISKYFKPKNGKGISISPITPPPPYCNAQNAYFGQGKQTINLDKLADTCYFTQKSESKCKADVPDDFDFRPLKMIKAINGNYYPESWLKLPDDEICLKSSGRLKVQRIVDEFVSQPSGVPLYWVKFEGYQISEDSIFKTFQLINDNNKIEEWRLYQKQLLNMARNQFINPYKRKRK